MGTEFQLEKMKSFLETDVGGDCTALGGYLMPLNATPKMVSLGSLMLCVSYHS